MWPRFLVDVSGRRTEMGTLGHLLEEMRYPSPKESSNIVKRTASFETFTAQASGGIWGGKRAKSLITSRGGHNYAGLQRLRSVQKAVELETLRLKAEESVQRDAIMQRLVAEEKGVFLAEEVERQKKEHLRRFEKTARYRRRDQVKKYMQRCAPSGRAPVTGTMGDNLPPLRDKDAPLPSQISQTTWSRDERCSEKRIDGVSEESTHEEERRSTREGDPARFHWEPKLTKAEQDSLRRALNMQKKCVETGQPQRAAGRVHKGPSFKTKPEVILFADFEVDNTYTKIVEITNISLGFNTFRICPLPGEIQDVIDVEFAPPGRMSAGSTTSFKVIFKPTRNVRIDSHLPILAPTGPEKFGLCCLPMKTVIQFSPPLTRATDFIQSVWKEQNGNSSLSTWKQNKHSRHLMKEGSINNVEKPGSVKQKQDEEGDHAKVVVLDMGKFQLGAVGTRDLNLKNSGALGSQYVVVPIVTDVSNLQFPLPQISADSSTAKSDGSLPIAVGSEVKDNELPDALGEDGFPSQDMDVEIMPGDRLILNESFSATHQQTLAGMGFTELLDNWNYDMVNIHLFAVENYASILKAHESTVIRFNYAPSEPGNFYCIMLLKFKNPLVQATFIVIKGICLAPPLAIEFPEYSFNICIPDRCYRHFLTIQNFHDSAMKVWIAAPSPVKGELWFDPPSAFVQPQQKLIVTALFSPKHDFFTRFPQFAEELNEGLKQKHPGSMEFCIPVRIEGSDVILPVETALTGILTKKEINLVPPTLDYGLCAEESAVSLPIFISNPSLLMAEYCFFYLPPGFSVYNAINPSNLCNAEYDTIADFASTCPTSPSTPTSSSSPALKRSGATVLPASGTATCGENSLVLNAGPQGAAGAAEDSLMILQGGAHGWVAPGDSHKCLIVYCPGKYDRNSSSGSPGTRPVVSVTGEEHYSLTVRVLMGSQFGYEAHISAKVLPMQTPLLFKPSAFLRLSAVPEGESVTQSIVARLSPHALNCAPRHPLPSPSCASTKRVQVKVGRESPKDDIPSQRLAHDSAAVVPREGGTTSASGGRCSLRSLVVQILPPPYNMSCLTFNPACFSLSLEQPSRHIAVSFSPNKEFMNLTRKPAEKNALGSGHVIGADKCHSTGKTPPLSSADSSAQPRQAGEITRIGPGNVDGLGVDALSSSYLQQKVLKPQPSRPPSKTGEARTLEATGDASTLRLAGESSGLDVQEDGGRSCIAEEEDVYKRILAYGGVRWCSATTFHREKITECEGARNDSDSHTGEETTHDSVDSSEESDAHKHRKVVEGEPIAHMRWKILVRWHWSTNSHTAAGEEICELSSSSLLQGKENWSLSFIEVATCATPPMITASSTVLNFGDVTIGSEARLRCLLRCTGISANYSYATGKEKGVLEPGGPTHVLKAVELPWASCFELTRAIRPLTIERPLELVVGFQPRASQYGEQFKHVCYLLQNYRAKLQLVGSQTRQTIELRGRGIEAELVVTPPDQDLDFGAVMVPKGWTAGSTAQALLTPAGTVQYFYVRNPSSSCKVVFDVTRLAVSHPDIDGAAAGRPAATFGCFPVKGLIPPGETQQLVFCFRPTHAEGRYTTVFQLSSRSGVHRPHILRLRGLAVPYQLYAAPYAAVRVKPDLSNEEILSCLPRSKSLWERPALQLPAGGAPHYTLAPASVTAATAPGTSTLGRTVSHTVKDAGSCASTAKAGPGPGAQHATAGYTSSYSSNNGTSYSDEEDSYDTYMEPSTGAVDGDCLHGRVIELLFESEEEKEAAAVPEGSEAANGGAISAGPPEINIIKRVGAEADDTRRPVSRTGSSAVQPNLSPQAAGESSAKAAAAPPTSKLQQQPPHRKRETRETNVKPMRSCCLVVGAAWSPAPTKAHGKDNRGGGTLAITSSGAAARENGNQQQAVPPSSTAGGASGGSSAASTTCAASGPVPGTSTAGRGFVPIVPIVCPLSLSQQPLLSPYAKSKTEVVGSFEFIIEEGDNSSCFSVEPSKGSLTAGSQQIIQFTFNPNIYKVSARMRAILSKLSSLPSLGQWVQATVKGVLRGGFSGLSAGNNTGNSNSGASNAGGGGGIVQEFTIILKAYRRGPYY